MLKSLNELYDRDVVFYHCNALGEINVAGKDPLYCGDVSEMPEPAQVLYNQYQDETGPYRTYVVNIGNRYGMAYVVLFDYSWLDDNGLDVEKDETIFGALNTAVRNVAERIMDDSIADLEFYVGNNTDPDGDELMLFVPMDRLAPTLDLQEACVEAIFGFDTDSENDVYDEVLASIRDILDSAAENVPVCRFCHNATVDGDLTSENDFSSCGIGSMDKGYLMYLSTGGGRPTELEVFRWNVTNQRNDLIGSYRPKFCPECGRKLVEND